MPDVVPVCSSGDCTWDLYGSIGICSDVVNVTASGNEAVLAPIRSSASSRLAVIFNNTFGMISDSTYGGFMLSSVPSSFPVIVGPMPNATGAFNQSVSSLLINDNYIAYSDELMTNSTITDSSKLKFLEVAFYWCTKTFSTDVAAGVSTTEEVSQAATPLKPVPSTLNFIWSTVFYPCYMSGTCNKTLGGLEVELGAPPGVSSSENYTVDVWTALIASALVSVTTYDALLVDQFRGVIASNGGGIAQAFGVPLLGDLMTFVSPPPEEQLEGVRNVSTNIARSMTNL